MSADPKGKPPSKESGDKTQILPEQTSTTPGPDTEPDNASFVPQFGTTLKMEQTGRVVRSVELANDEEPPPLPEDQPAEPKQTTTLLQLVVSFEIGRSNLPEFILMGNQAIIGSAPDCDIVVKDPMIPAQVAHLSGRDGQYFLSSLTDGSFPVFVNGNPLKTEIAILEPITLVLGPFKMGIQVRSTTVDDDPESRAKRLKRAKTNLQAEVEIIPEAPAHPTPGQEDAKFTPIVSVISDDLKHMEEGQSFLANLLDLAPLLSGFLMALRAALYISPFLVAGYIFSQTDKDQVKKWFAQLASSMQKATVNSHDSAQKPDSLLGKFNAFLKDISKTVPSMEEPGKATGPDAVLANDPEGPDNSRSKSGGLSSVPSASIQEASKQVCASPYQVGESLKGFADKTGASIAPAEMDAKISDWRNSTTKEVYTFYQNEFFRDKHGPAYQAAWNAFGQSSCGASGGPDCDNALIEGATRSVMEYLEKPEIPDKEKPEAGFLNDSKTQDWLQKLYNKYSALLENPELMGQIKTKWIPDVKPFFGEALDQHIEKASLRSALSQKISAIELDPSSCDSRKVFSLNKYIQPKIRYNPENNSISLCASKFFRNTSEFHLIFVIAHLIAHSIDPCFLGNAFYSDSKSIKSAVSEFPFKGVLSCLSENPYNAQFMDLLPGLGDNPIFCRQVNTLNETFADWLAVEVLSRYMIHNHPELNSQDYRLGYANALVAFENEGSPPTNQYLTTAVRADYLLGSHPTVRAQMGCDTKTDVGFCTTKYGKDKGPKVRNAPPAPGP